MGLRIVYKKNKKGLNCSEKMIVLKNKIKKEYQKILKNANKTKLDRFELELATRGSLPPDSKGERDQKGSKG